MSAHQIRSNLQPYRPDASRDEDTPADNEQPAAFRLGYRPWLDGLRGIAILVVVGGHVGLFLGGGLGVDAFFVLSGFLITTLLVEEWQIYGAISLKRFYLRRIFRLQPALYAVLAFGLLYTTLYRPGEAADFRRQALVAATYTTNWPGVHVISMTTLNFTWSLSIEEQFYLVWPILLYLMLRAGLETRSILWVALAGAAFSAASRLLIYTIHVPTPGSDSPALSWLLMSSHTRADGLLLGCAAGLFATSGLIPHGRWFARLSGLLSLTAAVAIGYMVWTVPQRAPAYFQGLATVFAGLVALVILHLLAGPSWVGRWVLGSAPLVIVGRLSYSLYLVHMPVLVWVPHGPLGWWAMRDVGRMLSLIFAAAIASYIAVERPFLRLKRRFETRLPKSSVAAAMPEMRAAA